MYSTDNKRKKERKTHTYMKCSLHPITSALQSIKRALKSVCCSVLQCVAVCCSVLHYFIKRALKSISRAPITTLDQKSPVFKQKSPIVNQKSPIFKQKSPTVNQKSQSLLKCVAPLKDYETWGAWVETQEKKNIFLPLSNKDKNKKLS